MRTPAGVIAEEEPRGVGGQPSRCNSYLSAAGRARDEGVLILMSRAWNEHFTGVSALAGAEEDASHVALCIRRGHLFVFAARGARDDDPCRSLWSGFSEPYVATVHRAEHSRRRLGPGWNYLECGFTGPTGNRDTNAGLGHALILTQPRLSVKVYSSRSKSPHKPGRDVARQPRASPRRGAWPGSARRSAPGRSAC